MKLVPMRFKGTQWKHNPRELSFACDKKINEIMAPYDTALIQETGRRNVRVRGEGELYGEDCERQFERLYELFRQGGEGILSIPGITPIYAVFESIKLIGTPRENILTYRFEFREVMDKKRSPKPISAVTTDGENLWDISYKYGIGIDSLVALNPKIKRPDEVASGEVIRLC